MAARVLVGDVREVLATLPDASVQCVITSPPYWNLRDYGVPGQIGLEPTVGEYVQTMVNVFAAVHRVLRPDGTLWLNLGDTYATTGGCGSGGSLLRENRSYQQRNVRPNRQAGLAAKNLIGVPWRVAFALQDAGWILRQEIIWHKPSPMPESVKDRFCRSHEHVFLLTKSDRYYFDWLAGTEPSSGTANSRGNGVNAKAKGVGRKSGNRSNETWKTDTAGLVARRYGRTVWKIAPKGFRGAHFATFPPALVERCLLPATSERGACAECGAPLVRDVARIRRPTRPGTNSKVNRASDDPDSPCEQHSGSVVGNRDPQRHVTDYETTGWRKSCRCETTETRPCVVLDPFAGSGTTLYVCNEWGRDGIGIELNPEYAAMAIERAGQAQRRLVGMVGV